MGWSGGTFTRSNGQFTGATLWASTHSSGRKIRTDDHDTHDEDLRDGINNCLTKDGQNSPTENLPMNSHRHTGVANAVARTDYAAYGQVLDLTGSFVPASGVGGTANAITLSPDPAYTSYLTGMTLRFLVKTSNSTTATVNVNGLGVKFLTKYGGATLDANDLNKGNMVTITYDGSSFYVLGVNPAAAPDVNSVPTGVISPFGGTAAPSGYLMCHGAEVSRTTYSNLYTVIGVSFGQGDYSTTFNLPDLRDEFLRGARGNIRRVGTSQRDDFEAHSHASGTLSAASSGSHKHDMEGGIDGYESGGARAPDIHDRNRVAGRTAPTKSAGAHTHNITGFTNTSGGTETRPQNIAVNYIIKT